MVGGMKRYLIPLLLVSTVALAQDIPNHAIPIGRGPGAVGFGFGGPCAAGQALVWSGPTVDPVCGTAGGSGGVTTLNGLSGVLNITAGTGVTVSTSMPNIQIGLSAPPNPTAQKFLSGSGTYTTPAGTTWIEVTLVGAGGGGGGGGTGATAGNGGAGGASCWNTSGAACTTPIYSAGGGGAGVNQASGSAGGTITGSGTCSDQVNGGAGTLGVTTANIGGGPPGGSSIRGGAGGGVYQAAGGAGAVNSGSGGQGGSVSAAAQMGASGGAGASCYVTILGPAATYTYAVGAAGTAGTAGTSGFAGGAGGSGIIFVVEHYAP